MGGKVPSAKHAISISDRSGMQFPYNEMVREWNGAWVHISEFEPKQPQLELKVRGGDAQALEHPRPPSRSAPAVAVILPVNPFLTYQAASGIIMVYSPAHGRSTGDTVVFRGPPEQAPGTGTVDDPVAQYSSCPDVDGILGSVICQTGGNSITVGYYNGSGVVANSTTDWYYFTAASGSATTGGIRGGGGSVSAGPATLTP